MILGHAAGDRVLIEVAKRLAEFGGSRYQTYRLGGDEFAMVLYDVHSNMKYNVFAQRYPVRLIDL